ncbi:uncharacterized protein RCO7_03527 [Rhynchosporium graminicola]|uniref:Uncharacterized protein n=1 Tax=Rhynchosporium graminicola TaxID=2792576 RepID=A0A1E1LK96_9HELO|nr:uncharacterized protein RCO7_03527 [Rhynchosporium commune]
MATSFLRGGFEQEDILPFSAERLKRITWTSPPYPTPDLEARYRLSNGKVKPSNIHMLDALYDHHMDPSPLADIAEPADFLKYMKDHADPINDYDIETLPSVSNVVVRAVKRILVVSPAVEILKDESVEPSSPEISLQEMPTAIGIPGPDVSDVQGRDEEGSSATSSLESSIQRLSVAIDMPVRDALKVRERDEDNSSATSSLTNSSLAASSLRSSVATTSYGSMEKTSHRFGLYSTGKGPIINVTSLDDSNTDPNLQGTLSDFDASELHEKGDGVAVPIRSIGMPRPDPTPRNTLIGLANAERFPGHNSLILKWYPPFVAVLGPQEPLSMLRQNVEAKALKLFDAGSRFEKLSTSSGICIPRVLKLDIHNRVLAMSDIGDWPTMKDALQRLAVLDEERDKRERENTTREIEEQEQNRQEAMQHERRERLKGGRERGEEEKAERMKAVKEKAVKEWTERERAGRERETKEKAEREIRQQHGRDIWHSFTKIGNSIGEFFAKLHAPSTINRIPSQELLEFENLNVKEFNYSYRIQDLKCILRGAGIRDYSALMKIIIKDWKEPAGVDCFAIGDLTTESFLLQDTDSLSLIGWKPELLLADHTLGLIGWQFAGPGRGINGDMAKLFASIRILTADTVVGDAKHFAATALLKAIIKSYCRQSRKLSPPDGHLSVDGQLSWNGQEWDRASREFPQETMAILRSAFIVYGRSLIDAAWAEYELCKCDSGPHPYEELCGVRGSLLGDGVWHIRMAGIDVLEFENNWRMVMEDGTSPLLGFVFGE